MYQPTKYDWAFVIGVVLMFVIAFLGVRLAQGAEVEIVAEVPVSDSFEADFKAAVEEMVSYFAGRGCLKAQVMAMADLKDEKPIVRIIVSCIKWEEARK